MGRQSQFRINLTGVDGSGHDFNGFVQGDGQGIPPAKVNHTAGVGFVNGGDLERVDDVPLSFDIN